MGRMALIQTIREIRTVTSQNARGLQRSCRSEQSLQEDAEVAEKKNAATKKPLRSLRPPVKLDCGCVFAASPR
jgi:hypothetical protein